ncbi:MAG: flagellin B, partial [Gammaproteobacteria bacterium]|nr:flagellin B [Gammaproteobacteria bacterium]
INTNIAALNAHANSTVNNRNLDGSLSKLSSGLRINAAADDASGMAIADSLRSQASALGQAIANANDAIGIVQIADKAMDEQLKILDTIKVKATQAAQDGQSAQTRKALQADITRLIEQLDNIAGQTSYNGQSLLNGSFTNKEFQVGAYSNQTIKATIGNTTSATNGSVRYESFTVTEAASNVVMSFSVGGKDIDLAEVDMRWSVDGNRGLAALADVINKNSDITGVRASWEVKAAISEVAEGGDVTSLRINGILIGTLSNVAAGDADGELVNAINAVKQQTGVEASIDSEGKLILNSTTGRGIVVSGENNAVSSQTYGRLTLSRLDARDIKVSSSAFTVTEGASATVNLHDVVGDIGSTEAVAMGHLAITTAAFTSLIDSGIGVGVTTMTGAQAVIDIAESAQKSLDAIRSDLGSVQNQLVATINNISVTQVNVKAAESNIRDVDFAAESANFNKFN